MKTEQIVFGEPLSPVWDNATWSSDWDPDGPDQPVWTTERVPEGLDWLRPPRQPCPFAAPGQRGEPDVPSLGSGKKASRRFFKNPFRRKNKPEPAEDSRPPHPGPFAFSRSWFQAKAAYEWSRFKNDWPSYLVVTVVVTFTVLVLVFTCPWL